MAMRYVLPAELPSVCAEHEGFSANAGDCAVAVASHMDSYIFKGSEKQGARGNIFCGNLLNHTPMVIFYLTTPLLN